MSNIILCVLLVVATIGFLFATIVALGVGSMCQKSQDDIRELRKNYEEIMGRLDGIYEFNQAVTDCMSGVGNALDIINERTNWLDGVNEQISSAFEQNKDEKKS